jgi:hypothetical protein
VKLPRQRSWKVAAAVVTVPAKIRWGGTGHDPGDELATRPCLEVLAPAPTAGHDE